MTAKKIIGKLHLWLGLLIGLLVFIIAITGSLYAFKDEIQNATQPYRFVKEQGAKMLPPSTLIALAKKELPGKHVHAVLYTGTGHSAKVIFYRGGKNEYYYFVYINQYTGEVLKVSNEFSGFFHFVLEGHFYLWLPHEVGKVIVSTATLLFFFMLVTGIVLWWPRNKNGRKQRFRIRLKNVRWRRKNYDLHSVLGFYVSWMGIIFAITGLVWGFEWFARGYYATISGGSAQVEYTEPVSDTTHSQAKNPLDKVWYFMKTEYAPSAAIEIHVPENSRACIAANANPDPTTYWKTDYRYFDQYSLKEVDVKHMWGRYANLSNSDKLMRMNYDIHVGAVWGLWGKVLACLASLVIASLPVTGFMIYLGRRRKMRRYES